MAQKAQRAIEAVPPPPARFTLTEWYLNNRQRYRQAEDQQHLAERIRGECDRVCKKYLIICRACVSYNVLHHRLPSVIFVLKSSIYLADINGNYINSIVIEKLNRVYDIWVKVCEKEAVYIGHFQIKIQSV